MIVKKITVKPRVDDSRRGYLLVPKEGRSGRVYFGQEPEDVPHTDYVNRRLRCGDLVRAKPATTKKKKEG
jgi:hypothetical protein